MAWVTNMRCVKTFLEIGNHPDREFHLCIFVSRTAFLMSQNHYKHQRILAEFFFICIFCASLLHTSCIITGAGQLLMFSLNTLCGAPLKLYKILLPCAREGSGELSWAGQIFCAQIRTFIQTTDTQQEASRQHGFNLFVLSKSVAEHAHLNNSSLADAQRRDNANATKDADV